MRATWGTATGVEVVLGLMENMVERKVFEIEALHANVSHLEIPQPLPTNFPLAETMAELDTTEQRLRWFIESDAEITETITTQLAAVLERGRPLTEEMQNELERTKALRDLVQRSEAIELVVPADDPSQPKVTVGRMSADGLLSTFAWDIARLEAGIATKERAMEQSVFGFRVSLEG
ncbi:uncharacterized protein EHS24_007629 [Apiotrichum porosum]|uniref:Uncharacterized protein n=1 Tax=Apiotrichum porosum TaxID=105984 RepID=A0A427XV02_9TREE|nr:uncharacterized protein EHS24_007629 [Apiotrichum porosum]RSH82637.1 hypothetical protein EHS24_007629 [Apiotrichum porosum]